MGRSEACAACSKGMTDGSAGLTSAISGANELLSG
jgi:hypothetical protein